MEAKIDKLNVLDFSPGIRASYINENFDLIKKWIDEERLRIGGWGVVEGFNLTVDTKTFTISVSDGAIISPSGEKLYVTGETFNELVIGPPKIEPKNNEEITLDEKGSGKLSFAPYSDKEKGIIRFESSNPEYNILHDEEFIIVDTETNDYISKSQITYLGSNGKEHFLELNSKYAGRKIKVSYLHADDRIDAILVNKDGGDFRVNTGIMSSSPSQPDIISGREEGYYLLGLVWWRIGRTISAEILIDGIIRRPVYVNENNELYLNGEKYTGHKFIYFATPKDKPVSPEDNELWYDTENDILYIWREAKGKWEPVNDLSRFKREYNRFTEDENPDDLQTFMFDGDKSNLRFIPGQNELTIIVDQIQIMKDQYDEIYDKNESKKQYDRDAVIGKGIQFKYPLDRKSVVEVFVDRNISTKLEQLELFPHIAAFIYNESFVVTEDLLNSINTNGYIEAKEKYEIGNFQFETWVNGLKIYNTDGNDNYVFTEITDNGDIASIENHGEVTNKYLVRNLKVGDKVSYKITRAMANYDNFRKVTDNLNEKVEEAVTGLDEAKNSLNEVAQKVSVALDDLKSKVTKNENNIEILDETKVTIADGIGMSLLTSEVSSKLFGKFETQLKDATTIGEGIELPNIKTTDVIFVHHINNGNRIKLINNRDYFITEANKGIRISISNEWLISGEIYIETIAFGV